MTATLISFLWVGGKYKAKAQHLFLTCYSNHCDLVQNMPHVELLAAWKGIVMMQNTLRDLQSFGLNIPKEFIVFTIGARTTLLQLRTHGVFYINLLILTFSAKSPQRSATCKLTSTNKNHLAAIHLTATHLIATQLCLVVQRFPQTQVVTVLLLEHRLEPLRVHLLAHLLKQSS